MQNPHNTKLWIQEKDIQERVQHQSIEQEIELNGIVELDAAWGYDTKYFQIMATIRKGQNHGK